MAVTGCDLSSAEQRVDEQGTIVAGGRGGGKGLCGPCGPCGPALVWVV
jgi:hypothetical protein